MTVFMNTCLITRQRKLGDQNYSYFHRLVKVKNSRHLISHLWDGQGRRVDDVQQIKYVAIEFYRKLLGTTCHVFEFFQS
jgi:hypothetical protein